MSYQGCSSLLVRHPGRSPQWGACAPAAFPRSATACRAVRFPPLARSTRAPKGPSACGALPGEAGAGPARAESPTRDPGVARADRAVETAKEQGMLAQDKANALVSATIGKIKSVLPANGVQGITWMANEQDCANKVAELKQKVAASK
jgi:hypothetical protein